jgi:hypothetical protein
MRKDSLPSPISFQPNEDDIREYAYHLYVQSGCIPGRELDNWLEARACLGACIPQSRSHARLHHHLQQTGAKTREASPALRGVRVR